MEHFQGMTERYRSLERLLSDMALEPPNDSIGGVLAVDPDEGPLILSTIHSAKGLEFHSVFIIWALEGRFPSLLQHQLRKKTWRKSAGCSMSPPPGRSKIFLFQLSDPGFRQNLAHGIVATVAVYRRYVVTAARTGRPGPRRILLELGELNMVQLLHYIVVFVSGAVLMALEIAGSRVLAPHFGSSIFVWGSLISVVMTALSIGYYWGGWLSAREPSYGKLADAPGHPRDRDIFSAVYLSGDQRLDRQLRSSALA